MNGMYKYLQIRWNYLPEYANRTVKGKIANWTIFSQNWPPLGTRHWELFRYSSSKSMQIRLPPNVRYIAFMDITSPT